MSRDTFREFLALFFMLLIPFFGMVYLFLLFKFCEFLFGGSE